jgi:hypothetical protein
MPECAAPTQPVLTHATTVVRAHGGRSRRSPDGDNVGESLRALCARQQRAITVLERGLSVSERARAAQELERSRFVLQAASPIAVVLGCLDLLLTERLPAGSAAMVTDCQRTTHDLLDLVEHHGGEDRARAR